ncbi:sulfatase-like hydrolase/transferase [Halorhabdus amylolytica]|uniref:sulfatase-like hydrolase/transferase n=1 Tax=Halorhabdus amylolytica TaxID=2559573 RepID=UPI0010A9EDC2|nr:sulfatase-like hydrolase/transferase [Halorhabdus amylolytica]
MNILYITVDALRADHVREDIMPFTRSFFDDAVEFTECIANGPGTPWSFPALLASRYAGSTEGFGIPGEEDPHPTLAEVVSEEGYSTGGFTDNRFASSAYNYDRGIDDMRDASATTSWKTFKQFIRENLDHEGILFQSLLRVYHLIDNAFVTASDKESRFVRGEVLVDDLLDWSREQEKWFSWLHPMDVHAPYEAPDEYQRLFLDEPIDRVQSQKLARTAVHHPEEMNDKDWKLQKQLYKAECRYLDNQIKRLFNTLSDRNELNETIIVFTADHGDMHGEHGRGGHPQEFWEEVIRVPLAISLPKQAATRVENQVCLVDLPPTILSLLDVDVPSQWDGDPLIREEEWQSPDREYGFIDVGAELDREHAGVRRTDGWKLLRHQGDQYLFDISENPEESEEQNRIDDEREIYELLSSTLDEHLDQMQHRRAHGQTAVEDEEMIEDHLKELGYLE